MTRASDFIFERLKYLWNKCESDLLYNKASDFVRRVLIKTFPYFYFYRAQVGLKKLFLNPFEARFVVYRVPC